ncbi:hypothetical protein D3C72_1856460 [compost metagenome]
MGVDRLLDGAAADLGEFRRHAHHPALGGQLELRLVFRVFQRDVDLAAARDRAIGDEEEVEQQLDAVLGDDRARTVPADLGLLFRRGEILGGLLGLAGVDRGADRARSAEGEPGELQADRGVERAGADEVHRIGIGTALVEQFEAVVDRAHGRDHVMADAAAQKCSEVGTG